MKGFSFLLALFFLATAATADISVYDGEGKTPSGDILRVTVKFDLKSDGLVKAKVEAYTFDSDPDLSSDPEFHCYTSVRFAAGKVFVSIENLTKSEKAVFVNDAEWVAGAEESFSEETPCEPQDLTGEKQIHLSTRLHFQKVDQLEKPVMINLNYLFMVGMKGELTQTPNPNEYGLTKLSLAKLMERGEIVLPLETDKGFIAKVGEIRLLRRSL